MTRSVRQYADATAVAEAASSALILRLNELLKTRDAVHLSITGGTVGILTLAKLGGSEARDSVDWKRVHIWWGDERFVPANSLDRNANQAKDALLSKISIPDQNIHEFPAATSELDLNQAEQLFSETVEQFIPAGFSQIPFDITLLGMGPDGHIASLFPEKPVPRPGLTVIAEADSPKPPPQRLSFTYEALNASHEIWFLISGADKAEPVAVAFSDDPFRLPVGRVSGADKTIWFIDQAASGSLDFSEYAK